ncbi:MAG: hypothetical protein ACKV2O_17805 [Acidimicrobiales bacterium]
MKRRTTSRPHQEAGQVGGIEVLPLALLVFVAGALLVANAWAVVDAKMAASAAAREAARAYAEVPSGMGQDGAWAGAVTAARDTLVAYEMPPERVSLHPLAAPDPLRCARVVVEAGITVPFITVPWLGAFGEGFVVRARHSELVDPFRSGLEGDGCA